MRWMVVSESARRPPKSSPGTPAAFFFGVLEASSDFGFEAGRVVPGAAASPRTIHSTGSPRLVSRLKWKPGMSLLRTMASISNLKRREGPSAPEFLKKDGGGEGEALPPPPPPRFWGAGERQRSPAPG